MISILKLLFPGGITLSDDGFEISGVLTGGSVSAKSIDICSDLVTVLNGGTFPISFTAETALAVNLEDLDLSTLKVFISPVSVETEWATRGFRFKTYTIAISILQHVSPVESGFPPLMELAEEIDSFLSDESHRVLSTSQAALVSTTSTIYDFEQADSKSWFIGVVIGQYKVRV